MEKSDTLKLSLSNLELEIILEWHPTAYGRHFSDWPGFFQLAFLHQVLDFLSLIEDWIEVNPWRAHVLRLIDLPSLLIFHSRPEAPL